MPYHLFGLISMTSALWSLLLVQASLFVAAAALCFVPIKSVRAGKRLISANTVAVVISIVGSGFTVLYGYVSSFGATSEEPSQRAAQIATGLLTAMNGVVLGGLCAIALGALLMVQSARQRAARRALPVGS